MEINYKYNQLYYSVLIFQIQAIIDFGAKLIDYNNPILRYLMIGMSTILLIQAIIQSNQYKQISIKPIITFFCVWIGFMILSSISTICDSGYNYLFLKQFFSYILLVWLFPLTILCKIDSIFFSCFLKFIYINVLFYIFTVPFLFFTENNASSFGTILVNGSSILLLTIPYHNKRKVMLIIGVFILSFIINAFLARRNQVVYLSLIFFFSFILSLFSKNNNFIQTKKRKMLIPLFLISSILGLLFMIYQSRFDFLFYRFSTGMESRETVIEFFFTDFNTTPKDWIWGRGIFGEVQGGVIGSFEEGLRDTIENGYLYLILKGGWLYLGLLIIISLKAMYNGFFKSKNLLSKAFASLIFIYYVDMIGYGLPNLSIKYLMIFISMSCCLSKYWLNLSDEYIYKKFGLK